MVVLYCLCSIIKHNKRSNPMYERIVTAIEPFALTLIILAGAQLSGWMTVTNGKMVGYATVFFGVALVLNHIVKQVQKG